MHFRSGSEEPFAKDQQHRGLVVRDGASAPPHHQEERRALLKRGPLYWKVMSRHFEMSEPRPEEMVMQPRNFRAVVSLAQIA
jgi:hypothetical protein